MLAQHLITRPVFDALFEGYSFAANNPVSRALQSVLDVLDRQHLEKEAQSLQGFYDSVRNRAKGIRTTLAIAVEVSKSAWVIAAHVPGLQARAYTGAEGLQAGPYRLGLGTLLA